MRNTHAFSKASQADGDGNDHHQVVPARSSLSRFDMKSVRSKRAASQAAPTDRWHIYAIVPQGARAEVAAIEAALPEAVVKVFSGGHEFLSAAAELPSGVALILDPLPEIETLALVAWLGEQRADISSIVASAGGSTALAVRCLKAGAADFIQRPLDSNLTVAAISAVFEPLPERPTRGMALRRLAITRRLSFRELEVLEALISGLSNKEVGTKLQISERTVEVHRSRIMRRLDVASFAELVRITVQAGIGSL